MRPIDTGTIAHLLAENGRYYGARVIDKIRALDIQWRAASRYASLRVPAWNESYASALRSDRGPLASLLALDRNAVANADRILAGEYRLFGTVIHSRSAFPDWHLDYLSGHRFPLHPYLACTIDVDRGSDIICPWELSRFQFVPTLVSAFRATRDERYRDTYFAVVADWQARNPYLFGVNWMSGLDIAIRALNIAFGMIFLVDPGNDRGESVRRLLWAHIVYLQERDLYEPKRVINNHQLIAAAIHLSLLRLFVGPSANAWKASARKVVAREVARQFHQDGGNFESAFGYHQFVLEALAIAALFEQSNITGSLHAPTDDTGGGVQVGLRRGFAFVSSYTRAWGEMPQIGDSSDGRVLLHRDYFDWRPTDPAYLTDLSELLFPGDEAIGAECVGPAHLFPESGVGTFSNSRYGVVVTALPVDPPAGGHNHFDQTSIVLRVDRHHVLVDSGTYCYTSDMTSRTRFRSGRSHNVVLVAGTEPGHIARPGTFAVPDFGGTGIGRNDTTDTAPEFTAYHNGYARVAKIGPVTRRVRCLEDRIEILDEVDGTGDASVELVFNLHPGIIARAETDELALTANGRELARMRVSPGWLLSRETGAYSVSYRSRCDCPRVVFSRTASLPIEVRTSITVNAPSA